MIIRNAWVFSPNGSFRKKDVYTAAGKIVARQEDAWWDEIIDADGCLLIPGLIDIHSHGAVGVDASEASAEKLRKLLRYEYENGITGYCPTTMTMPFQKLKKTFASVKDILQNGQMDKEASLLGLHMEGPFISPFRCGAQDPSALCLPDVSYFADCQKESGNTIRLLTMAPELAGSLAFIQEIKEQVRISIGHTDADYTAADKAFSAGAAQVTHLYNAMPPFHHRAPGVIGAALDHSEVMVELIGDGIHVHPSVIRSTFSMFGRERVILISDSMMAAGMPDGNYSLGGQSVKMEKRRAVLSDGTLAGSAANLMECLQQVIACGVPREAAIMAATANPARALGLETKIGRIAPGMDANLLLMDNEMRLLRVI